VIVTDTIPLRIVDANLAARIDRLSTAAYFAEAIRRLHSGGSLVELQGG